ncbi:MAG: flagellar motor switch protein FliN [Treponema sp.]|jgi:flagellar motor switch protein FliN/FliY|nr:flagellar motor switch protein FliN [Treponema sp.]
MSDGALSQDEIDALLSGVGSDGMGSSAPTATAAANGSEGDRKALESFLASTVDAQASNLSMMTGSSVSIKAPKATFVNQDTLLALLPDKVTVIRADFNSGFPGDHLYVMPESAAKSIAGLINKEDNIELDEMAMSVIGEAVGTIIGSQITALTSKTGNKSISNMPPTASNVPKAAAALPAGDFFCASYNLDLGDGVPNQFWEILGSSVASDIARALSGAAAAPAQVQPGADKGMGAMGMMGGLQGLGMGVPNMGMGNMMGNANVQSVQFPNLMPHATSQEAGNISLIMDVFMEMTVELGRTRKLIKEILSMGEGTIIELDKLAGEPVDILVNHKLIAKGEVVVIDENFGVRVTEIVSPMERMNDLG